MKTFINPAFDKKTERSQTLSTPIKHYLVITAKFPPRKGGSNTTFDEVYRRIGEKATHIVTNRQPGCDAFDANHPNTVHRLDLKRHPWLRPESLVIYGKLLFKSLLLARSGSFDEVHAGRVLPEGLVGWMVARIKRIPVVIYAHGEEITTWLQPGKFQVMVFVYRRADRIIANSEFTRGELIKLGVSQKKIDIVVPGVDLSLFRPGLETEDLRSSLGINSKEKLILSVGRLSRRKGFDHVIRSIPWLSKRHKGVQYAIIGIGEDREYLLNLAEQLNISRQVHLLGHVSDEDLPRWYNAADVFAMPNRDIHGDTEGFGKVYIEAAACGKASISGISGGTGSAVLDGVTGLRVDGSSVSEITGALERLLTNPGYSQMLGSNGLERAKDEFSWETAAKAHQ